MSPASSDPHPFDLLRQIEQRCLEAARKAKTSAQVVSRAAGFLAIRLRNQHFTVPLSDVDSIEPLPPHTRLPGVQRWLLGIANLRGVVITITDLGALLFGSTASRQAGSRLIIASHNGGQHGLLVDEVIGLRRFEAAPVDSDPVLNDERLRHYVNEQRRVGGQIWLGLNLQTLLQDQAFQHAALRGPSNPG